MTNFYYITPALEKQVIIKDMDIVNICTFEFRLFTDDV